MEDTMEEINIKFITFPDDKNIRYFETETDKWFILKDVINILKLTNVTETSKILPSYCKNTEKINTNQGKQQMIIINTEGITRIMQSTRSIFVSMLKNGLTTISINLNIIYACKEIIYLRIISSAFKYFSHQFQYRVGKYQIDLYFIEYKIAIECDENNHKNKKNYVSDKDREEYIKNKLGCVFIRFNPDENDFNIGDIINNILEHTLLKNVKRLVPHVR